MKPDAIKWHMIHGGLSSSARFRVRVSDATSVEGLIEQFQVSAPDGSIFLIQITKVKDEDSL